MERAMRDEEQDLSSCSSEELKTLYHKVNTCLAKCLLNGACLENQKENIRMLNEISAELNRRKGFSGALHTPGEVVHL